MVGVFVSFWGIYRFFVVSGGGRETRAGELVACAVLVCVDTYSHYQK